MALKRGALIVFEGCDRSGKTTQIKRLVDRLNEEGSKTKYVPTYSIDIALMIIRVKLIKCAIYVIQIPVRHLSCLVVARTACL